MYAWSREETTNLLNKVKMGIKGNPGNFEKPTAKIFYFRYCRNGRLAHIKDYKIFRAKMLELRRLYFLMHKFKQKNEDAGANSTTIKEKILKVAPYYDVLDELFRHEVDQHKSEDDLDNMSLDDETDSLSGGPSLINLLKNENDCEAESNTEQNDNFNESQQATEETTFNSSGVRKNMNTKKTVSPKNIDDMRKSFYVAMEQAKLELENEKLKLEKERLARQLEFKQYELNMKMELKKLEAEMQERIRLYELELKEKCGEN